MAKLVWRVKLVAETRPGVTTETEVARIERDEEAGLAGLGSRLEEAKQLTAALQAQIVPAQVTVLGECRRSCVACGGALASKGHCRVRFRSLFGDVPLRVRRLLLCPCQGGARQRAPPPWASVGTQWPLNWPTSRPAMRRWRPSAGSPPCCPSCCR